MNEIKEGIKAVLFAFADALEAERQADFGEVVERILESKDGVLWWKTPENFSVGFIFPAVQVLETAMEKRYPDADRRIIRILVAIYAHYNGIQKHIKRLIDEYEGSGAVVDKTRRLINAYVTWLTTGELDNFEDRKDPERRGWDCPSVGTPAQWGNFIKGLLSFYMDGDTISLFMPYRELLLLYQRVK